MRIIALLPFLSLIAAPAIAQTSPPAQQGLGGTPVPGVCLLSREAIFANAKVGVAATARLKQLTDQAQAELDAERKPLDAEIQALQTEATKLTPERRRVREAALAPRLTAIQTRLGTHLLHSVTTATRAMAAR